MELARLRGSRCSGCGSWRGSSVQQRGVGGSGMVYREAEGISKLVGTQRFSTIVLRSLTGRSFHFFVRVSFFSIISEP